MSEIFKLWVEIESVDEANDTYQTLENLDVGEFSTLEKATEKANQLIAAASDQEHQDDLNAAMKIKTDPWINNSDFPVADWQSEVVGNETRLGYVDWIAKQKADAAEELEEVSELSMS
jgi:hypothetical protein